MVPPRFLLVMWVELAKPEEHPLTESSHREYTTTVDVSERNPAITNRDVYLKPVGPS